VKEEPGSPGLLSLSPALERRVVVGIEMELVIRFRNRREIEFNIRRRGR